MVKLQSREISTNLPLNWCLSSKTLFPGSSRCSQPKQTVSGHLLLESQVVSTSSSDLDGVKIILKQQSLVCVRAKVREQGGDAYLAEAVEFAGK